VRLRWFRSAFWTLVVCLGATTLLAICGYGTGGAIVAAEDQSPAVVHWPSQGYAPPTGAGPSVDPRTDELVERVKRLEAAITRLNGVDVKLSRADDQLARRLHVLETKPQADPHAEAYRKLAAAVQGQSRQLADFENRLRTLRDDFQAHVLAGPTDGGPVSNTIVVLPLPMPVAAPVVAPPLPPPPVEEDFDLDYEIPASNAGRTETITIHRTAARRPVARVPVCDPCALGLCPRCGQYHFSTATPPWTTRW
jgi:hypothetical protein